MVDNPITVVLVDDHEMITQGLGVLLNRLPGVKVVGTARNGRDGIKVVDTLKPSVVLLDIELPVLNGIEAAQQIHKKHPKIGIVMLSAHPGQDYVIRSLRAGAVGYVSKGPAFDELRFALRTVANGQMFLSPVVCTDVLKTYLQKGGPARTDLDSLTPQQQLVTQLLAEGATNKQVAGTLSISMKTAEKHRHDILERLNLSGIAALTLFAVRSGLVDPWNIRSKTPPRW